jgi:ABC-type nickel/cobalt efflux system permease component RcnA
MTTELSVLLITAVSLGFFHTLFGPDHYLPFIVLSKSGNWTLVKTAFVTVLCGLGHVMSSVILGTIGVVFGIGVNKLEIFEAVRGNLAAWVLIAFGLVYFSIGVRRAVRNKPHKHFHPHSDGTSHEHVHVHSKEHLHVHEDEPDRKITPWVLFIIFFFGPCEPLIPLLMYPAARGSLQALILVTAAFSLITILTMVSIVLISAFGLSFIPFSKLERYTHAIAGAAVLLCGVSIQFLGL